jgi:hypothetical protein
MDSELETSHMPYKYSPEQKAAAMVRLERNHGDLHRTAAQTGVSIRSLYEWSCSIEAWLLQHTPLDVQDTAVFPAFENDLDSLSFVRKQIMEEIVRTSASLKNDTGITTPYQRVHVLSQLVDKLMKLDDHLRPYKPAEMVVRVVRVPTPLPDQDTRDPYWAAQRQHASESEGRTS